MSLLPLGQPSSIDHVEADQPLTNPVVFGGFQVVPLASKS